MKYIDADLIKSTQSLYFDIDSCIDELLKARTEHKQEDEGKALFHMEGLMVATLQQLDCIIDSLQQEQQEVDLEKEIDECWQNWLSPSSQSSVEGVLPKSEFSMYARHFYELGLRRAAEMYDEIEYNRQRAEEESK